MNTEEVINSSTFTPHCKKKLEEFLPTILDKKNLPPRWISLRHQHIGMGMDCLFPPALLTVYCAEILPSLLLAPISWYTYRICINLILGRSSLNNYSLALFSTSLHGRDYLFEHRNWLTGDQGAMPEGAATGERDRRTQEVLCLSERPGLQEVLRSVSTMDQISKKKSNHKCRLF